MSSSNSQEMSKDLYSEETQVSNKAKQNQRKRKYTDITDVSIKGLSQDAKSKKFENVLTFKLSPTDSPTDSPNISLRPLKSEAQTIEALKLPRIKNEQNSKHSTQNHISFKQLNPAVIIVPVFDHSSGSYLRQDVDELNQEKEKFVKRLQQRLPCTPSGLGSGVRHDIVPELMGGTVPPIMFHPQLIPSLGTNPTLGIQKFEMSSELSEINSEVTRVRENGSP